MKMILFFLFIFPLFSYSKELNRHNVQTLRICVSNGLPRFIHYNLERDSESTTLTKSLYEGLTRINLEGKVKLALAKKIEVSKCKTIYTIYLRESKWSNGQELTAKHFVDAWKASIIPGTRCLQPFHFFCIKNAKKVFQGKLPLDNLGIYSQKKDQIIIHLEYPIPYFDQLLADPYFSPFFDLDEINATVFNGPFILDKFYPGKKIYLKKNPFYWDKSSVKLENIEISEVADPITAYKLFQEDEMDFVGSPFSDLAEEIISNDKSIKSTLSFSPYWIFMNTKKNVLSHKNIRKALSLAIDRDYIAKHILSNAYPGYGILPKGLSFMDNNPSKLSPRKLKELFYDGLKKAGISIKDFSLTLSYTATTRHANIAKYLKYQWEKIFGIRVILDKNDWSTFYSKLNLRNYEIGGFALYAAYPDPEHLLNRFCNAKTNRAQWENAEFKKFIDLANQCISKKKREKYLAKAEEILFDELPVMSIYTHKHLYLCRSNLKNLRPSKLLYQDFKWVYFESK